MAKLIFIPQQYEPGVYKANVGGAEIYSLDRPEIRKESRRAGAELIYNVGPDRYKVVGEFKTLAAAKVAAQKLHDAYRDGRRLPLQVVEEWWSPEYGGPILLTMLLQAAKEKAKPKAAPRAKPKAAAKKK